MERAKLSRILGATPDDLAPVHAGRRCVLSHVLPADFMAALAAAVAARGEVFLCDPAWGTEERSQLDRLLAGVPRPPLDPERGWLMIPSGGSSGTLKFARHDQDTINAAVGGFLQHFGVARANVLGVLPLHHVSGLMGWMRSALSGGDFQPADWRQLAAGNLPPLPPRREGWITSLVPSQLERLLNAPEAVKWLAQFRLILLGGAPAWPELLARAAAARLPLALGYGMTETAAMICALRPSEFLAGGRTSGGPLPHGRVTLRPDGTIEVGGNSLFRGYYPDASGQRDLVTNDLGVWEDDGQLRVIGRRDGIIISGGEKIVPAEVEAVLRDCAAFGEVAVVGVPHRVWGEAVVAAYAGPATPDLAGVKQQVAERLAPAKRPKFYVPITPWPANAAGKVLRPELTARIRQHLAGDGATH